MMSHSTVYCNGEIAGLCNGDATSLESFKGNGKLSSSLGKLELDVGDRVNIRGHSSKKWLTVVLNALILLL